MANIDASIYDRIDTNFGQKLASLFNPSVIAERDNKLASLAQHNQMQSMQMQRAQQEMQSAGAIDSAIKRGGGDLNAAMENLKNVGTQDATNAYLKMKAAMEAGKKQPVKLSPDEILLDENNKELARGLPKPEKTPNWKDPEYLKYEKEKALFEANLKRNTESSDSVNWQTIQTENGYVQVNPKTGATRPLGVSKPANPLVEMKIEEAKNEKEKSRNQQSLSAQQVLDQAATLYAHPGRQLGTGMSSFMSAVPGTDARGFKANLDTFKAQTFVPMVSALKGMGALSDAEGKKLSESVGALDPGMPEEEFAKSLQGITAYLYNKAKVAGLNVAMPEFAGLKAQPSGAQTAAPTQLSAPGKWGIQRVQ